MKMKLSELIEVLENAKQDFGDLEIRFWEGTYLNYKGDYQVLIPTEEINEDSEGIIEITCDYKKIRGER
jgi:hypothetical protein